MNIVATTFLSGISGSSVADVSAIGSVMIPQMEKIGYPRAFATNVTISASVQAILVPPSHNAVIYSLATGGLISITSLFMAGVVPGLLLGAALIALVIFIGYRDGHPRGESVPHARRRFEDHVRRAVGIDHDRHHHRRHPGRHIHRDRGRRDRLLWAFFVTMFIYRDYRWRDLPDARASHAEDRRDGDDVDRLRVGVRLRDGADAAARQDHGILPDALAQPGSDPDADQHHAARPGLPDGSGAAAADLHADPAAGRHAPSASIRCISA